MNGSITLPVWLIPVIVTLGLATVGALWRTAAELSAATLRLLALESRIAVIAQLETAVAVLRAELTALEKRVGGLSDDVRHSHPSRP